MIQRTSKGSAVLELAACILLIAAAGFTVYAIRNDPGHTVSVQAVR